jgi:hypothetical protein
MKSREACSNPCHCSMCRKAQGAAFRSRARVRAADFHWVAGEELLTFYESSRGNHRGFCRICGSPILTRFDIDNWIFSLPLGPLDDDPGIQPQLHVYVASKAPWPSQVSADTLSQIRLGSKA